MDSQLTPDRIVASAGELGTAEFTRAELAKELGASIQDIGDAFKAARKSGRLEKVRDNEDGKGVFRLTGQ